MNSVFNTDRNHLIEKILPLTQKLADPANEYNYEQIERFRKEIVTLTITEVLSSLNQRVRSLNAVELLTDDYYRQTEETDFPDVQWNVGSANRFIGDILKQIFGSNHPLYCRVYQVCELEKVEQEYNLLELRREVCFRAAVEAIVYYSGRLQSDYDWNEPFHELVEHYMSLTDEVEPLEHYMSLTDEVEPRISFDGYRRLCLERVFGQGSTYAEKIFNRTDSFIDFNQETSVGKIRDYRRKFLLVAAKYVIMDWVSSITEGKNQAKWPNKYEITTRLIAQPVEYPQAESNENMIQFRTMGMMDLVKEIGKIAKNLFYANTPYDRVRWMAFYHHLNEFLCEGGCSEEDARKIRVHIKTIWTGSKPHNLKGNRKVAGTKTRSIAPESEIKIPQGTPGHLPKPEKYDSKVDTQNHIASVREKLGVLLEHFSRIQETNSAIMREFARRFRIHDFTKLESPEKETFDRYTPMLWDIKYGSEEYKQTLDLMRPALEHHYGHFPHHPEHYCSGFLGMSLVDLLEMIVDWMAASERHADGDVMKSIQLNQSRFKYSDEMKTIFENTVSQIRKDFGLVIEPLPEN